ncbi:MAG TPA: phosphohistidine phosphatase SixA [Tepidisphaeraceae bacterium]|jgi:phosphohistidine phosphatase|nr:phosphohistidine phosphatase SixA [Tepidisphaeraceae bacterium]
MTLYLVRHGKARKGGNDRLRPLTRRGIRETRAAAQFLKRMRIQPVAIWHSNRVRAVQTARILEELAPKHGLIEQAEMGPDDSVGRITQLIRRARGELIIVGHLPHLGKLVAKLIDRKKAKDIHQVSPSTIVALRKKGRNWLIDAVIPPPQTAAPSKRANRTASLR